MFVGLDLHKKYSQYSIMDVFGTVLREGRVENALEEMREFSESIPPNSSIAIESSSTWYWAHRLLSERHAVTLSNPVKNKAIASAKAKTGKTDAAMLATLLRGGFVAECYVPSKETMEFRELVRYRANLVRDRTRMKNRVHSYLPMNNMSVEASPFSREPVDELRRIDEPRVKGCLRLIDALGMGASGSTFYDDAVTEFFSPHTKGKGTMIAVGVGVPAYRARPGTVLPQLEERRGRSDESGRSCGP